MEHKDELTGIWAVAEDTRTPEEKAKDYPHQEFLGGAITTPAWIDNKPLVVLSLRKQITSSSCGAQSLAKALEAFNGGIVMSATPPYHFRSNFPNEGMFIQNIGEVGKNAKTTTEALCPSQFMTEEQMNAAPIPDLRPYGISAYYPLPIDMDLIAAALEKGHAVIFGIGSNGEEWQQIPAYNGNKPTFSHFVVSHSKNYLLHNGEKSAAIDDSCNAFSTIDGKGQRILTESFLRQRCWAILAVVPDVTVEKPKHIFNVNMVYGDKGDEVKALQECLIDQGLLKNGLNTGYFGTFTLRAVMAFQLKYKDDILKPAGLSQANGKVLTYTRKKLNELYS